jgi:hypothetical protein
LLRFVYDELRGAAAARR